MDKKNSHKENLLKINEVEALFSFLGVAISKVFVWLAPFRIVRHINRKEYFNVLFDVNDFFIFKGVSSSLGKLFALNIYKTKCTSAEDFEEKFNHLYTEKEIKSFNSLNKTVKSFFVFMNTFFSGIFSGESSDDIKLGRAVVKSLFFSAIVNKNLEYIEHYKDNFYKEPKKVGDKVKVLSETFDGKYDVRKDRLLKVIA